MTVYAVPWRAVAAHTLLFLVPFAAMLLVARSWRLLDRPVYLVLVLAVVAFAVATRRRVTTVNDHGIVANRLTLRWPDVADIAVRRRFGGRAVVVTLRNGATITLPAPYGGRWLADPAFDAKAGEIRERWQRAAVPVA